MPLCRSLCDIQCAGRQRGGRGDRPGRPEKKARAPGLFEVRAIGPPPESLGIHALPPYTHNGDGIEVDGQSFVVTALELRYRLEKGKYVRDHNILEVQSTGRYFYTRYLDDLLTTSPDQPTGKQD